MESNPLVTVMTPTYNRADFLPEAMECVLAQTFGDFELILVDDGSTDNSNEIIADYKAEDGRIRSFRQENKGQSVA